MATADVIVVGGGISGLAFAWKAGQAGKKVRVLERDARIGGCLHSHRRPDGYWFEMGAHSVYNSYGAFLDIAVGAGVAGKIIQRGPARGRFGLLRDGDYRWLTPPKVLLQLNWLEAALSFPAGIFRKKDGETVYSYYSKLVGRRNYDRVISPFFAAVPSQKADGFPLEGPGSLFKKRPRREEFVKSFGFDGGLQLVCDAAARSQGVEVETGAAATRVSRAGGEYAVTTADGRTLTAPVVAVAAPPDQASALLRDDFHELSTAVSRVGTVQVESVGVVLPRERCWMPECAFLVPVDDLFFSAVTRDPFPDPRFRAFAFHFKAAVPRADRLRRVSEVLRIPEAELGELVERRTLLPSPALGHGEIVAEIDRCLAGGKLALTGNYFAGLAIEDCVLRSNDEWRRVNSS
ncbi:protoporphyrinogen/coproporphyrinogen oxidase [Anaeromyxobacter oryzae]|uniref:FAD-dependent oxidoreductase n=1 Tax=Anaeromyxobacter oryzae TaxID=2918170 RepID=A0ABM7WXJ3_9BACT|nr:FAD-dependent oxidoreductase [Anaeromyxobacter oryzae]BDG04234.1 FAD-dependent oxidoreductase [Anaeromyxobacter oryzae]